MSAVKKVWTPLLSKLEANGLEQKAVRWLIFHPASLWMIGMKYQIHKERIIFKGEQLIMLEGVELVETMGQFADASPFLLEM